MKIACVLITSLPMKAELRRHPELRGRPFIVTEGTGSRQSVLDASPEAKGVMGGMPLQEALSHCKDAALLEADRPYYHTLSYQVIHSLTQRSPLVEKDDLGCAYVGLDGLEAMYGGEARLVASLFQAVPYGLDPRIGVAGGKFPAYIAALASGGGEAIRAPDDVAGFLRDFAIDHLPLSWDSKVRLHRFGIHTMGQLASLSVGSIQSQLGVEGRKAWKLSNGVDDSLLIPYKPQEVVTESLIFPSPTTDMHTVLVAVETLLGRAFSSPELRGRYVRMAIAECNVLHKPPWTRRFAFKEAVNGKGRAFFAFRSLLETVVLPGPLEDMKLVLSGFAGESGAQTSLFSDVRRRERLTEMMRQLETRLGRKPPIYQVRDIEPWSRIPERRQALVQFVP